jgi:hypothetical protein
MAEFGSFAASSPATYSGATITPAIVQALSQYASGWFSAIVGANSPCLEDWNALCYLFGYQLSYLMMLGVPEWDSGTTYYAGSIAQDGSGNLYVSLTNSNLNNALSSSSNWKPLSGNVNLVAVNPATGIYASPYTLTSADIGKTFLVNSANGPMQFNLPQPSANNNFNIKIKDVGGVAQTNKITMHRYGSENIDGVATDYVFNSNYGKFQIATDATNWWLL